MRIIHISHNENFKNDLNKLGYAYVLDSHGLEGKTRIALDFYERKKREYENLMKEVERLGFVCGWEGIFLIANFIILKLIDFIIIKKEIKKL